MLAVLFPGHLPRYSGAISKVTVVKRVLRFIYKAAHRGWLGVVKGVSNYQTSQGTERLYDYFSNCGTKSKVEAIPVTTSLSLIQLPFFTS